MLQDYGITDIIQRGMVRLILKPHMVAPPLISCERKDKNNNQLRGETTITTKSHMLGKGKQEPQPNSEWSSQGKAPVITKMWSDPFFLSNQGPCSLIAATISCTLSVSCGHWIHASA